MLDEGTRSEYKLLVVEDDFDAAQVLKLGLNSKGYTVFIAADGHEGLKLAYELLPDLVILDIMMPGMNGFDVCVRLRDMMDIPILMLTAMVSEGDILHGFHVGADDYLRKPYSITELDARIRSLLRRHKQNPTEKQPVHYFDGSLSINPLEQTVAYGGESLTLSPTEFKVLYSLLCREGRLSPRYELMQEIWGGISEKANQLLSMYISRIRQKLKAAGSVHEYVRTNRGKGYSFIGVTDESKQS